MLPLEFIMPTYVYETDDREPQQYEFFQRMSEPAFTRHPETGEAIHRVPAGGIGILTGAGRDEMVDCSSGACQMTRAQLERNDCSAGSCGAQV
jgi:predicted nucleic acid-binding Zn ribbon protein